MRFISLRRRLGNFGTIADAANCRTKYRIISYFYVKFTPTLTSPQQRLGYKYYVKLIMEDIKMRHLSLATGLALAIATCALAPAMAEMGGPTKNAQGQCKARTPNSHNGDFYYWDACPKPAAATVIVHRHHHRG
jgi:hypothetical protein